mgnify:CR=1 FL=1|jgi:Rnl2 family RNA ligase
MKFIKYPKTYRNIEEYKIDKTTINKHEWIATEKLHGSNCSIYYNGNNIQLAKRSGFLEESESFYGFNNIKWKLENPVNNIFNELKTKYNQLDYIIIYGEFIGGWFPESPSEWKGAWAEGRINNEGKIMVPQKNRAIQEGVYYGNMCGMFVFDIWAIEKDEKHIYIDYDEIIRLCNKYGLDVVQPLARGTFNKLSKFNINFDSTIPQLWGQSKTYMSNNLTEGVVIRPVDYNDIGFCKVKIKHDIFAEICQNSEFTKEDSDQAVTLILNGMVNQIRYYNVVTETGIEICLDNKEAIIEQIMDDIIVDYHRCYDLPWENYDEKMDNLRQNCSLLVDKELSSE